MKSEHTSGKVVDHRDRLDGADFLSGLTVEDANVIQVTELSGPCLVSDLVHFKMRLLWEYEDFVVSLDVQLNAVGAALSIDTRDGELIDVGDLR